MCNVISWILPDPPKRTIVPMRLDSIPHRSHESLDGVGSHVRDLQNLDLKHGGIKTPFLFLRRNHRIASLSRMNNVGKGTIIHPVALRRRVWIEGNGHDLP